MKAHSKPKSDINESYYDKIAGQYEEINGNRKPMKWVEDIIKDLASKTKGNYFLDVCSGSGYIANIAAKYFKQVIAIDVSQEMLNKIDNPHITTIKMSAYDIKTLWYQHFDVVCCFAGLHHLYNPMRFVEMSNHVLKHNGYLYTDHDLCGVFYDKWKRLVEFKRIFDKKRVPSDLLEDYSASEVHSSGLPSNLIPIWTRSLKNVSITTHWQGTLPIKKQFSVGKAPYLRIIAQRGMV